ncbi:MAG: hypothetical protein JJU18_01880 [Oceanicaulis sp.]|nr:hypothetical protein [Oceanicaulis sp.]
MQILVTSLAALALSSAAHPSGPAAKGLAPSAGADINCAALYSNLTRLNPEAHDAWRERGIAAVNAHIEAEPPAPGAQESYSTALNNTLVARIEAVGAPILALQADTAMDQGERMAGMITEFTAIWSGVRACDARYRFDPLPSPFNWID